MVKISNGATSLGAPPRVGDREDHAVLVEQAVKTYVSQALTNIHEAVSAGVLNEPVELFKHDPDRRGHFTARGIAGFEVMFPGFTKALEAAVKQAAGEKHFTVSFLEPQSKAPRGTVHALVRPSDIEFEY